MAHVTPYHSTDKTMSKAWLKLAAAIKRTAPTVEIYRHAPAADASVERVRELAGIIRLSGSAPSPKFLEDDGDAE